MSHVSTSTSELFHSALTAHESGDLAAARQLYEQVLTADSAHAEATLNLGVVALQQGDIDEGLDRIRAALAREPHSAAAHAHYASGLQAQGRNDEAIESYRRALAIAPDHAEAHYGLGTVLLVAGRSDEATAAFRSAATIDPDYFEAHIRLAELERKQDDFEGAARSYERALAVDPDDAEALFQLAICWQTLDRQEQAAACYERALAIAPERAEIAFGLGNAHQKLGRLEQAVAAYRHAIAQRPDMAEAYSNLGAALQALKHNQEAVACYEKAIALKPDLAELHNNLGVVLRLIGRHDESADAFRKALALAPDLAMAHSNLGSALMTLGQLQAGQAEMAAAIGLEPRTPSFYRALGESVRFAEDDPHLVALEAMARDIDALSEDDRLHLHFALGKAYADLGRYDTSFDNLLAGNAIKRSQIVYDEAPVLRLLGAGKLGIDAAVIAELRGLGHLSPAPIFIIGMPRSGSTLIEQILASHPQVFAAGERTDFAVTMASLVRADGGLKGAGRAEAGAKLHALGSAYVERMRRRAPDALRITDKQLGNFRFAGLIHLALPNARIIHARRNPVDTCVSCFSILFGQGQEFSYELGELGRAYCAYSDLMDHWRQALPRGVMLDVQYEDVVADLEGQARRIVAHCGLAWDKRCLSFHRAARPVHTASVVQVRQPIYRSSVGRWEPYRERLKPLLEALAPVLTQD